MEMLTLGRHDVASQHFRYSLGNYLGRPTYSFAIDLLSFVFCMVPTNVEKLSIFVISYLRPIMNGSYLSFLLKLLIVSIRIVS